MGDQVKRKPVVVWSANSRFAAEMAPPRDVAERRRAIILAHCWRGLNEQLVGPYADTLAAAGIVRA